MTGPRRVVVLCTSARNAFLEAWVETIAASGAATAVLVDTSGTKEIDVPARIADRTVLLPAGRPPGWEERIADILGGPPEVVFDWWGIGALAEPLVASAWPGVPHVLCVDTFPNASRLRAAARDVVRANLLLGRVRGLVHASREMAGAVARATAGRSARLPSAVVTSPFPLSAHRAADARAGGATRLCFTGRSDYLYSGDPRMSKDAVGGYLERFIDLGAEVHVLRPDDESAAARLADRGYAFYPAVPREALLDGGFAGQLGTFDGHLVTYAQSNRTAVGRIRNSLSTRWATGVCGQAPIVVPTAARFAEELFERSPIGFRADDPAEVLDRLRTGAAAMRAAWARDHPSWAGEASADDLADLWEAVVRR